jgi:hypothetical protein
VVANNSGELPVGCSVKVGGVLDSSNELNWFEWVHVIELLEGMDEVRVGRNHPLVEEEVARTDGGTSVIETHKGHSDVKGMSQVNSNCGHQVVDADWERRKTGAGGGRLLEDLDKDCAEADSFTTVIVRWHRPIAAGHPCRQDGASTTANATREG